MPAPQTIIDKVDEFKANKDEYKNPKTTEEQTKTKLITPLFKALGWDMDNDQNLSPQYQEVEFETQVKEGKKTKNVDYSFRLGGSPIFFVEAKKPSRNLATDRDHARQARKYGWNAGVPICILTDFEEFVVYDTTFKTSLNDSAKVGRLAYYKYTDYIDKWDEIYNIFSKEAVQSGKFDEYAKKRVRDKKGTERVDDEFLKEIEEWRLLLARNIALRNPELSIEDLNYAVQLTIDRIIFLRIAEARGIEKEGRLEKLLKKPNIYKQFTEICKEADDKYNSGLFHFKQDDDEDLTENSFTLDLIIDDDVFKKIFKNLYPPNSPYDFSIISTEILGKIYEQFLGKIIRLTDGHHAKIDDKPEVKKAGGVYYTPQYIVDYIVENTLGKKIKDKTPNQISKLRILDPACGSGSFLIRAYQKLLDHHLDYYSRMTRPPKDVIYEGRDGKLRLTITEKKRILKNNIYGVDIDTLAVEVTKLSLLLKVLEDQNKDLLEAQRKLIHERALPNLRNNIKTGNSLIESDILDQQNININEIIPFDWEEEYPDIFENGGFDIVIGNPPYIRMQLTGKETTDYCREKYLTPTQGNFDIYIVFVERAVELLNKDGNMGYILPHKFFTAQYGMPLRKYISEKQNLTKIIHFGDQQVFDNATTYTCLLFLNKQENKKFYYDRIKDLTKFKTKYTENENKYLNFDKVSSDEWIFVSGDEEKVFNKLYDIPTKLIDLCNISVGLQTSADKIYIIPLIEKQEKNTKIESKYLKQELILENNLLKPLLKGAEIKRYEQPKANNGLIFPYHITNEELIPLTRKELKQYPLTFDYLNSTKDKLLKRSNVDTKNWWLYPYPKNLLIMEKPKIIYQVLSQKGSFTLDEKGEYFYVGGGNAGGYAITTENNDINELKYLLGILNSNITTFFISKVASCFKGGYYSFGKHSFEHFPLPSTKLNNENLINLVNKMIQLNKELQNSNTPTERKLLQKQIELTDKKINETVYELYDITNEEIEIIEQNL